MANDTEIIQILRSSLVESESGNAKVTDVHLEERDGPGGELAWKITLFLNRPLSGDGWDPKATSELKSKARMVYDQATADEADRGPVYVDVTTAIEGVPAGDIAPEEEPSPGEVDGEEELKA